MNAFFAAHGIAQPPFFPMVRGRLIAINGRAVSSNDYAEDRAKRLIDREFNLSWADRPQPDNRLVAGSLVGIHRRARRPAARSEEGIAKTLDLKLWRSPDLRCRRAAISTPPLLSLRKVEWDTFWRANFS